MLLQSVLVLLAAAASAFNDTSWQRYVYGPSSSTVYPVSVLQASENVFNPEGLLPGGIGDTSLTRADGEEAPEIILDFGLNTVGFLNITFNGASDNTPGIRLAFSETQQFLSDVSDYSRSNMANAITPGSDQIAVQSSPFTWTNSYGCKNGTQVCSDGLHGFRYLKIYLDAIESDAPITSSTGTVNISSLSLQFSGFIPTIDSFQGWFECSDDQLNQFWYGAVYTNDLTTDTFRTTDCDPRDADTGDLAGKLILHDGAKRDRDPYVGDVAVSGRTTYLSHGNLSSIAARNVLADLGDHQRDDGWIPPASVLSYSLNLFDYPMWWVIAIWDYVLYTGDATLTEEYFPNIVRVLEDYYPANTDTSTGLLSKPAGMGDYAFVGRDGIASYYNALYVLALQSGAEIANLHNDSAMAEVWLNRADVVSAVFNAELWDDQVGAYKSSQGETTSHSQDGNSLAILAGIADSNRSTSALEYLTNATARPYGNAFMDDDSLVGGGSQRVYAFMSTFEIRARFETGDVVGAIDEIRRLYGWMHTHDPEITYWEGIGGDGSMYQNGFTSAAHGWSTGVVGLLTNYILGAQPLEPGGSAWLFSPVLSDLTFAQGQVQMDGEPLGIGWYTDGSVFRMEIQAPESTRGRVVIPVDGETHSVTHNGQLVWEKGFALKKTVRANNKGHIILDELVGGEHIIEAVIF